MLADGSLWGFRSWEWFQKLLETPESPWFDLGNGEKRDDVLLKVLQETVKYLERECGPNFNDWHWGALHRVSFGHILGQVKPLQAFFNRGPFPVGGDGTTIWSTYTSFLEAPGEGVVGPPFRYIADLSDLDHSQGLLAPGQSGQPGHPHYDDQVAAWFDGGYHSMLFDHKEIEEGSVAALHLVPKTDCKR